MYGKTINRKTVITQTQSCHKMLTYNSSTEIQNHFAYEPREFVSNRFPSSLL